MTTRNGNQKRRRGQVVFGPAGRMTGAPFAGPGGVRIVEFPVTVIEQIGVRRIYCRVPRLSSRSAVRSWLARVLDLGDPAAWHMQVRRQPELFNSTGGLLCAGDRLYLIRRPNKRDSDGVRGGQQRAWWS
jgi:hypothetical protein